MPKEARVFVVDDDPMVLRSLELLLESAGIEVETFSSARSFLNRPVHEASCLVLDLRLPDLDGLAVQERLTREGAAIPIVFLSGQADVPSAAKALRYGAVDFLVKPVDDSELLGAVARALARGAVARQEQREQAEFAERIARLTPRERQVAELVSHGLLNKQIAYELGISEETVKVHRGRVMRKMELSSVQSLVRFFSRFSQSDGGSAVFESTGPPATPPAPKRD
jgi:FixJ family two-component response regulator